MHYFRERYINSRDPTYLLSVAEIMRRLVVRLLLTVWALVTVLISLRLFTGSDVTDFRIRSSDPDGDDPVRRRRQLIRDHETRVLSGRNRTAGWTEYLRYASSGTRIWPDPGDDDDRIVNQLHLVHADPTGRARLDTVST